jgi:hypothetical protein
MAVALVALVPLFLAACPTKRGAPEAVTGDPASKPLPPPAPTTKDAAPPFSLSPSAMATIPPAPTSTEKANPKFANQEACEPIVRCGLWTRCVWFERLDVDRYRAKGSGFEGQVFVRRKDCSPEGAGPSGCAVFCKDLSDNATCVDGLHPEFEECTESAPPHPAPTTVTMHCSFGDGVCGSFI